MKSLCASSLLALVVGGCSFDPGGTQLTNAIDADPNVPIDGSVIDGSLIDGTPIDIDATPIPPDAVPPDAVPPDAMGPIITDDVAHVFLAEEYGGATADADLTLSAAATIDTSALTISGVTLPAGVTFAAAAQDSTTIPGPEIAILHVDDLTITAAIRVIGARPLVVVSSGVVTLNGSLDAGARRNQTGGGGYGPGMGPSPGLPGAHEGTYADSGGGGAGYATTGGQGGDSICPALCPDPPGGLGGAILSTPDIGTLRGGSGGGAGAAATGCVFPEAGAGGGAVQLYAAISITLNGTINVGGGGGGQGENSCANYASASGGGAAGSIYLQTPMLTIPGALYANGGGGGGSAGDDNDGTAGENGGAGTFSANGVNGGPYGRDGGDGGGSAKAAEDGVDGPSQGNGGGGGGSAGRIAIRTKVALGAPPTASPAANLGSY